MFSYKNIWSCDDPNYNPAFHISFKNLAVMGMMCLFVAYIRYEPDMSLALYATKILSYGFICMIIIKTARAYEILYGSSFNASVGMFLILSSTIGIVLYFVDESFWKFLCLYLAFVPLRIFFGLKLKKKKFDLHGDSYA